MLARLNRIFQRLRPGRQRGHAMAEFVLLTPVIIAMFWGIDYFRSGYARRIEAINRSQTEAWKLAYANDMSCHKNSSGFAPVAGGVAGIGGGGEKADEAINQFSSNAKDSAMFLYGHTTVGKRLATNRAKWQGGQRGTVDGSTFITCNEVVPKEDQNIWTPLKSFILSAFDH